MKRRPTRNQIPNVLGNLRDRVKAALTVIEPAPPVRTLEDMSPAEIADIERQYGCTVRR